MKKILFTGGGSAGHVLPNVALIEELLSRGNVDVCYMGSSGIEKELISKLSLPYYTIPCPKLIRGGGKNALKNNIKIPFAFQKAIAEAKKGLQIFQPDLVFSKGGYVALPVVFAAKKLAIPCLAHESDFSIGLANRFSAKKCKYLLTSFPETATAVRNGKYAGAPIRRSILTANPTAARKAFEISKAAKTVLVFGGGSGSQAINAALRQNLNTLTKKYCILHVCGKGNLVESNLKNYRQFEFISDMGAAYAVADLVVSRAGAGTVFELVALKKPAVLIPLEGATRGDQWQNAEYFKERGLCRVLAQSDLQSLPQEIEEAFSDLSLHAKLAESRYFPGNQRILREIYALLHA